MKSEPYINQILSTTQSKEKAQNQFSNNWSRPVVMQIDINSEIPYLNLDLVSDKYTDDVIIAPFTKVSSIEDVLDNDDGENSYVKLYKVVLENQELNELSNDEKRQLYNSIVEDADSVNSKLKACIELDKENAIHYENIRKLEQLLATHHFSMEQENYQRDTTDAEKQSHLDDIARINMELSSLKDMATKVFNIRQENCKFISDWKKKIIAYLMAECNEIKEKYNPEKEAKSENENASEELENAEPEKSAEVILEPEVAAVKSECLENIAMVDTLLNNIKNLISKQQNHARIAESIDSNYRALNNAFEMKNYAEELDSLVQAISNKIDNISAENKKELDKISKTNLQISTLLNYLNNAKAAVGKKITRFDEINIIEENELKKEIAETIKNIRCEAELKKLRDDLEIIEEKSNFKKFIGRFTGRNKLDQTMLDQIQVRQTAIRKTFKARMPLAYNYSIHELIAEIEMFVQENYDDELVTQDVRTLEKIRDVLKKNFVIIDSKVVSIIDQKTGKNLPLASRKLSKKELIEIDTYRFLNKYGYDKSIDSNEPEYQDTLANEIKRIVDYIKSSGVV